MINHTNEKNNTHECKMRNSEHKLCFLLSVLLITYWQLYDKTNAFQQQMKLVAWTVIFVFIFLPPFRLLGFGMLINQLFLYPSFSKYLGPVMVTRICGVCSFDTCECSWLLTFTNEDYQHYVVVSFFCAGVSNTCITELPFHSIVIRVKP